MRLCEMFLSIQGEGIHTGRPSIFIRTAGCNLKCDWCDTKFSWSVGKKYSVEKILHKVNDYDRKHVVISGGEPLIQKDINELINELKNRVITIETNGTIYNNNKNVNLYSLSPKLKSSKQKIEWREIVKKYIKNQSNKIQLKFVVVTDEDYKELKEFIKQNNLIKKLEVPVMMQPNGMTNTLAEYSKDYGKLALKVANDSFWKDYNVRVLMQNHRVAWKQKSGV